MGDKKANETVVLDMVDSGRMAALEQALEYAINKADGLNYVIDAEPILNDRRITAARLLLPSVKWSWVQRP